MVWPFCNTLVHELFHIRLKHQQTSISWEFNARVDWHNHSLVILYKSILAHAFCASYRGSFNTDSTQRWGAANVAILHFNTDSTVSLENTQILSSLILTRAMNSHQLLTVLLACYWKSMLASCMMPNLSSHSSFSRPSVRHDHKHTNTCPATFFVVFSSNCIDLL